MELTKRCDINVGYSCNVRCRFCYYVQTVQDTQKCKDLATQQIQRQLQFIRKKGISKIDFTGGEPTIRADFFELISFAKELGFQTICVITNGLRLSEKKFADQCVQAGVNDFLISIHGAKASTHDRLTGVPGSFDKAVLGVQHVLKHKVNVRTNCTISGYDDSEASEILGLVHSLGVQTANFILFNPIVEADWRSNPALNVSYSQAAPYLQEAIEKYKNKISKITVRYIPFCLMRGFERYVTNMPQIQYDPDEWDYWIRTRIREGFWISLGALFLGCFLYPLKSRFFQKGWNVYRHEALKYFLQWKNKKYGPACLKCGDRYICDGLWKKYAQWKGLDELKTVEGPLLCEPTHFMELQKSIK